MGDNLKAQIIDYVWIRDFYCAVVQINPYKFVSETNSIEYDEQYELRFSFQSNFSISPNSPISKANKVNNLSDLIVNSDIAEQFRSHAHKFNSDSSDSWINFNTDYLKLSINKDGIYRLNKSYFQDKGINTTGIDPKTFQLFNYGKEIPIFVNGESDLTFDDGDFIEFYGRKNYSAISNRLINSNDSPYNEYMNRYSDTTFYFLTWETQLGKRITEQILSENITDTLDYFQNFEHTEQNSWFQNLNNDEIENQTPNWNKNKTWYWNWLAPWRNNVTFNFSCNNLAPNKNANIFFKLVSGGSSISLNSHLVKMFINNIQIDSQVVNRFNQVVLNGTINSNDLKDGTNSIKLNVIDNGTNPNFLAYDWYEVEYPKKLSFLNDSVKF